MSETREQDQQDEGWTKNGQRQAPEPKGEGSAREWDGIIPPTVPGPPAARTAAIRAARTRGVPVRVLADQYGVSRQRISQIASGHRAKPKPKALRRSDGDNPAVLRKRLDDALYALSSIERATDDAWIVQRAGRILDADHERYGTTYPRRPKEAS